MGGSALFGRCTLGRRRRLGLGLHIFNHLVELGTVFYLFHKRLRDAAIADHPDRRRMLHANALAQGVVGFYLFGQAAVGVFGKRHRDLVVIAEFLHPLLQVVLGDLPLVGKDEAAKLVAGLLCLG